jgi:hypothetical protein
MPTLGMNVKKEDLNIDKHIITNIIKSFQKKKLVGSVERQLLFGTPTTHKLIKILFEILNKHPQPIHFFSHQSAFQPTI